MKPIVIMATIVVSSLNMQLHAGDVDELINHYAIQAQSKTSSFAGFDSNRGKTLYFKEFASGKKDTPSCTS